MYPSRGWDDLWEEAGGVVGVGVVVFHHSRGVGVFILFYHGFQVAFKK